MAAVPEPWFEEACGRVYGAAFAVSQDCDAAADVTTQVLARAVAAEEGPARLEERTILLASRAAPCEPLAAMRPEDRELVALARMGGRSTAEIAASLRLDEAEVRARITRGLRDMAAARRPLELAH